MSPSETLMILTKRVLRRNIIMLVSFVVGLQEMLAYQIKQYRQCVSFCSSMEFFFLKPRLYYKDSNLFIFPAANGWSQKTTSNVQRITALLEHARLLGMLERHEREQRDKKFTPRSRRTFTHLTVCLILGLILRKTKRKSFY